MNLATVPCLIDSVLFRHSCTKHPQINFLISGVLTALWLYKSLSDFFLLLYKVWDIFIATTEITFGSERNLLPCTHFISPICSTYRYISSILMSVSTVLVTAEGIIMFLP